MAAAEYRTVVVGTDGSTLAGPTVARAAVLARSSGADLVVVCAWTSQSGTQGVGSARALGGEPEIGLVIGRDASGDAVDAAVAVARAHGATVTAALMMDVDPAEALLRAADDRAADVIVVGATARRPVADRLLGDVADEVVRRATCDVLIVREGLADAARDPSG